MSASNLKALLEKAAQDTALQERLSSLSTTPSEDTLMEIIHLSQDYGLPVTIQELTSILDQETDLTDDALSAISGGSNVASPELYDRMLQAMRETNADKIQAKTEKTIARVDALSKRLRLDH